MKIKNLLTTMVLTAIFLIAGKVGWGQVTLPHYDGLDYTVGQALQTQTGWSLVNSGDDLLITSGSLSFTGLKASTGNKVAFADAGIDAYKAFTSQTSGTVYFSFILNVTALSSLNATGGYFAGLAQNSTTFGPTIWTGLDGAGYKIGINPRTTTANTVWVTGTQTLNNSIFVVVSYEIVSGSANDIVNIWINPDASTFEDATPPAVSATATNTTGTDLTSVSQIFLRQDSNTETPFIEMDELRVGLSWADVTPIPDIIAPVWTATYPNVIDISKTTATLRVNMDEPGLAYYQVLADGSTAPSVDDLIAGGTEISLAAGSTEYTASITGLTLNTPYDVFVVAKDNSGNKQATVEKIDITTLSASNAAEITAFSFAEQTGPATITTGATGTIGVQVAGGTDLTTLVATFTLSADASVKVGTDAQTSGVTANNFTSPVTYTVTAEDNTTTKDWIVTVTMPSTDATISSATYTVDNGLETITNVPFNTPIAAFESRLTPATAATFETYLADGTTVATSLADGCKVIVTAEAGNTKTYVIDLLDAPTGDLFISEYVEGSSNNKAIEIYNGTGVALDLSTYTLKLGANGGAWGNTLTPTGIIQNGDVFVAVNDAANAAIKAIGDVESNVTYFNGDDAIGLFNNGVLIDVFGQQGTDPGTGWSVAGLANATVDHTIIRKSTITGGNTDWASSFGTNTTDSEWEVYPKDYIGGLGSHNQPKLSAEANITGFDVTGQVGDETINTTAFTVTVGVTNATVKTALEPVVTVSAGATVSPLSGVAQDFTTNKIYTVTAAGGNTQTWTVSVVNYSNVASLSDLKVDGTTVTGFASTTYDYVVALPFGTTVTPTVTVTENSSATSVITPAANIASATAADRTTTVAVTSQDKTASQNYTVLFNVTPASTDATVTSSVYTVNSTDNTITNISYTETLAAFEGNITPAAGATFETYLADGTTVATDLATGYKLICTAEDGTTKKTYTITLNTEPSHDANITAYSILGNNGTINAGAKTIAVTVPYGTTLTNLVATFTLSANATAKVGATAQASGVTTNDFSSPVVYDVTAEDGATVLNWTVTVTVAPASTDATVTSTEYTVNSTAFTITGIPYNETLATFEGNLTPAAGATFETYLADGTTVATDLATGYKVIVTAQDGSTKNTYTITLMDAPVGDLFFSEYIEGSSNNKALEIYNGTGSDVDLSIYKVKTFTNGSATASYTQALTGTLVNGEVYVIANASANATILAQSDVTSTVTYYNGDDAVGLYKNDVLIDVIGTIGTDPGTSWAVAGVATATVEHTLIRKDAVVAGTTDWAASAGTDVDNSQWVVYPQDFASGLGSHKQPLPSTDNDILTFTIPTQLGTTSIDNVTHTVVVNMPTGTDVTALVPTITVSTGASISPASGVAQDFTTSKTYTVTAEGGNTQNWNVSVVILSNVATLSDIKVDNNSIAGFVSTTYDYTVTLPYGTTATPVVTVNTTDADADAVVTPAADVTSATAADRTTTIAVTAEDGVTTQNYTVLFNVEAPSTDATVTSTVYTVNSTDNTITDVPATETLATFEGNLTPAAGATFETYEADGTTVATNLATGYKVIVTAQDGTTKKTYTVTLNTVLSTAANILTYTVSGVNATVNGTNHTVAATLPYGTNLTALVATYTLSPAATAKVNGVAQQSGVTANDFTNPVVYNVTAEDGTTIVDWTVTITTEAPSADVTITSAVYTVNSTDNTITNVPYNETLATFEGNLTPATGATFETYQADGTTVATDLASGYKVLVTAQDGTTIKTYTITLNVAPPMDLFISEYIEGGSNNKAIEIYNPTNTTIDLTQYSLKKGTNGADYSTNLPLTGTLEPGDVYVVAHTSAVDSVKSVADYIDAAGTIVYFNGDDPIGLFKGNDLIDVVGVVTGTDPGDGWAVAGTANATLNHTLVRKDNVTIGTTDWTASAGTDAATSQWVVYPQDRFAFLGWHINKSSDNDILTFAFAAQTAPATINATAHTVSIEVLNGTAVTALVPTITVSKFATINPASGAAQDFTNPVVYTVTAQDGTTQTWTVTVTVSATISSQKDITSFSIPNQTSVDINAAAGTVAVVMPFGTDVTSLTPTIAVSAGANINPASGVAQDFTNPVEYTVTAQDASTKVWTVTVSVPDVALTSIHDIQYTTDASGDSPLKGQQVRTKGVVTAMKTGTSSFNMWLQDGTQPWGGIYVYGVNNSYTVAVGDSVELFATVDEYYNLTELKTITALNNLGAGTLPAVASIGISDAKTEAYEGMLVKITNVECTVVDAGNGMFTVSDGTNTMNIDDFLYKYTPAQGTRYDITGVIDFSYSEFKVLPRDASDVSINTSATVNPFATFVAYPNPFTNEIRFEGADVARVTVTSIIGQVVMDRTITGENYINTQELVRGIYLVKFTTKKGESVLRKLIKEY